MSYPNYLVTFRIHNKVQSLHVEANSSFEAKKNVERKYPAGEIIDARLDPTHQFLALAFETFVRLLEQHEHIPKLNALRKSTVELTTSMAEDLRAIYVDKNGEHSASEIARTLFNRVKLQLGVSL